jgi:hypothetical protein
MGLLNRFLSIGIFILLIPLFTGANAEESANRGTVSTAGKAATGVPTTLNDFFLPGSQPHQSGNVESSDKCDNCHGGYDQPVEPVFAWRGSMMAQAARDPLFFACMAIANQDAAESGDLCIRCHTPGGWLAGNSTPTDGSALTAADRDGVTCDFCHRVVAPSAVGDNPYPGDSDYNSQTYTRDQTYLATLSEIPETHANGMFIVDSDGGKRGPYAETVARHQYYYSPIHNEAAICGTCHDVSNPAFSKNAEGGYEPNDLDTPSPSFDPYEMFPIERTYSEWLMSAYNTADGVYAPQFGGNKDTVRTCQDCHMRDVTGAGCDKNDALIRDDLALHDLTGGNTFIPLIVDDAFPGETDSDALDSAISRATVMLQKAASMDLSATTQEGAHQVKVTVTNETGHKLPSGYPEGRRIWLNVKAFDQADLLIYESGAYDAATGVLTHDADVKIYEIKPGLTSGLASALGLSDGPSFHFVVNDTIYSDNRIPPRGFTNSNFETIQSPPVAYAYADGQYWDNTPYPVPGAASLIVVTLYYQTVSKEYVEFLRDENATDNWGNVFYDLWNTNGKSAPVAMTVDSISVTPVPGNQPPVMAAIGPKETDEGVELAFRVSATDTEGGTIGLSTSELPTGAVFTDSSNGVGSLVWTPDFDQAGNYPIWFIATDDLSAADSELVTITVHGTNRAPLLDPVGNWLVVVGETLEFTIGSHDPDGDSVIFTCPNIPGGALLTETGWNAVSGRYEADFSWVPEAADEGVHAGVRFVASDGSDEVESLSTITVSAGYCCGFYDPENRTGNVDYDPDNYKDISDILLLARYSLLGGTTPVCLAEANTDGDPECFADISDILRLARYSLLGGQEPALCLPECE